MDNMKDIIAQLERQQGCNCAGTDSIARSTGFKEAGQTSGEEATHERGGPGTDRRSRELPRLRLVPARNERPAENAQDEKSRREQGRK